MINKIIIHATRIHRWIYIPSYQSTNNKKTLPKEKHKTQQTKQNKKQKREREEQFDMTVEFKIQMSITCTTMLKV